MATFVYCASLGLTIGLVFVARAITWMGLRVTHRSRLLRWWRFGGDHGDFITVEMKLVRKLDGLKLLDEFRQVNVWMLPHVKPNCFWWSCPTLGKRAHQGPHWWASIDWFGNWFYQVADENVDVTDVLLYYLPFIRMWLSWFLRASCRSNAPNWNCRFNSIQSSTRSFSYALTTMGLTLFVYCLSICVNTK